MLQDQLKQAVGQAAVDYIRPTLTPNSIVGIGTGSTVNYFIDALALIRHLFDGAVASSESTHHRLIAHNIPVYDLNQIEKLSVYVDGADECNDELCLIKGGGAALTREKIVAACADTFVCIADESKQVTTLGTFPLPVEVIPMARSYVARELSKLGGNPRYREGVVTDNGNHILDIYDLPIGDPVTIETHINMIAGVVTNGLFALRRADILLLASKDGVKQINP